MHALIRIGPLNAAEVPGKDRCIVLLHGYGANAHDLYPLHTLIATPPDTRWVFPDGFVDVSIAPGYVGKAWFPIDIDTLATAMQTGTFRQLESITPPGLETARSQIMALIAALNLDPSKILIGGFSQGAMVAIDVALRMPCPPAGLVILSGAILNRTVWESLAPDKKGLPFFQSHGMQDPLLNPDAAKELEHLLKSAGLLGELTSFPGGHEIPYPIIQKLNNFIAHAIAW